MSAPIEERWTTAGKDLGAPNARFELDALGTPPQRVAGAEIWRDAPDRRTASRTRLRLAANDLRTEQGRPSSQPRAVRRLMWVIGIEALVPRPARAKPRRGQDIPYLLGGLKIVEPNHVSAADVSFIPMASGFLYLVSISTGLAGGSGMAAVEHRRCELLAAALEEAMLRFGKPRIFDKIRAPLSPQGFRRQALGDWRRNSMDERGRFMDNIFIERLWRWIKMKRCT